MKEVPPPLGQKQQRLEYEPNRSEAVAVFRQCKIVSLRFCG